MDTRKADLAMLRQAARSGDPKLRRIANEVGRNIVNESKEIRDMRKALVKAHRKGNIGKIKDIHEDIKKREKYQNPK